MYVTETIVMLECCLWKNCYLIAINHYYLCHSVLQFIRTSFCHSGNQLKRLPLLLDRLERLAETDRLSLYNNSLVKPPQSICDQGVTNLYAYLKVGYLSSSQVL